MNTMYWFIEYSATFIEWFLCSIFCGTFIKDADLKANLYKRIAVTVISE